MIGKKINQLATELAPVSTDLTIIGDPISGVSKKITLAQLGAIFSGAVSFYDDLASFPATGDINVIYCAKDTKKLYLWSGSAYVEVFPSQALLDTYQLRSEKGNANGYASLDSGGKVPVSQLPSSIMEYKGMWNAATNTPTLANGTGDTGDVYICNVAGTVNFGAGPLTFAVGDYVIYSGSIWQRSSGAVGTVTSVGASITGDSITISNSPISTSGTLAFAFAGTSAQYINGAGNLTTFPTLTGYVPYTGATANVDLGTYDLTADFITASRGSYTSSGGGNTLEISHTSGSGIALNITKGGNGEGLYINKTSGSGNAATIVGTLNATTLVKSGGTSTQFLKADGSVDSSTYVTTDTFQTISASKTFAVGFNISSAGGTNQITNFANTNSLFSGSGGSNVFGFNSANNIYFGKGLDNGGVLSWNNSAVRYYTLPDATGTIALVGGSGVGTVTSVAALSLGTTGTDLNSTVVDSTTTPVITLNVPTASATNRGALSSSDWSTFNNKQNALTNPVTGTGTTNYLPKFTGTSTIGDSVIQESSSLIGIGMTPVSGYKLNVSGLQRNQGANTTLNFGELDANNIYFQALNLAGDTSKGFVWYGTGELMRLNASGNLSIGNTNDTYKLDVSGTGRFSLASTGSGAVLNIGNVGSGVFGGLAISDGGTYPMKIWGSELQFLTGSSVFSSATTRLTIASTGAATLSSAGSVIPLKILNTTGTTLDMLVLETGWNNPSGNKNIIWKDATNTLGRISVSYDAGTGSTMRFGSLYNGGYQTSDLLTIASTGAATFSSNLVSINGNGLTEFKINNNTSEWELYMPSGGTDLRLYRGSDKVTFLANGQVGIGTTSPAAVLEVAGTSSTSDFRISRTVSPSTYFYISAPGGSPSTATMGVNGVGVMALNASGSVGIGTTSPTGYGPTLQIAGSSAQDASFVLGDGSGTSTNRYLAASPGSSGNFHFGTNTGDILFKTGLNPGTSVGTERMRITSGGVLLVNQTGLSSASAGVKMQINTDVLSTGTLAGYFWENRSGGVTSNSNWYGWYTTSGTIYMYNGSSNIASINASTGAYTALSDINKKKDFEDSNIGLSAILGLKPTLYRMKSENGTAKHLGFIAQQVKDFIPQAYIQTKGEKEDFIGIDDRPIIAALVKSVQELKAELDILKNK